MDLSKKLQIPEGASVFLVDKPEELNLDLNLTRANADSPVLVFALDAKALKKNSKKAIEAAKADRLSWIAYPKAGKLGTDLNRDKLNQMMGEHGITGVRMVSIDDVWAAMRFRPGKP